MKRLCQIAFVLYACSYVGVAQSSTKKELLALENRFNEALVRADLNTIDSIEADDLVFIDAAGMVTTKTDELQSLKSGDVKFESIKMDNTRVQGFGDFAVVTGRLVEKAQYKNADISGSYRFTDVWPKRSGKWVHVAGQETLVPPMETDAKNPQLKRQTLSPSEIAYRQLYASADGETHFRQVIVALTESSQHLQHRLMPNSSESAAAILIFKSGMAAWLRVRRQV